MSNNGDGHMWLQQKITNGATGCFTGHREILGRVDANQTDDGWMRLKNLQAKPGTN